MFTKHTYQFNTMVHVHVAYHNVVGVVNDNVKDIFHQECQAKEEPYHTNCHTKTTGIGVIVGTVTIILQLVSNTAKYNDRAELGGWEEGRKRREGGRKKEREGKKRRKGKGKR